MEHEGYSIVIRVHPQKSVLMGIKTDGIDESVRGSSLKLYTTVEGAIHIMATKIWAMKSTIKS